MVSRLVKRSVHLAIAVAGIAACGGSTPASDSPGMTTSSHESDSGSEGFSSSATVGGMDKGRVQEAIHKITPTLTNCVADGRKRMPYLGGDIDVFVQVNASGRAITAYFMRSTIGDHNVEACILKAFESKQWPRPVGGKIGEISQGFDFESGDGDIQNWSSDALASKMAAEEDGQGSFEELHKQLDSCRTEAGSRGLQVTVYVDEDGLPQTLGLSSDDPKGSAAFSCVQTIIQTTSFPAPGSSFAKVTLAVK